jgi:pheromone shutdown-related protein TraB
LDESILPILVLEENRLSELESSYEENIVRIQMDDKEIILLGTAHVSKESAAQVLEIVEAEDPDTIAVELCQGRYNSLQQENRWKDTDIIKVIKEKKAGLLLTNLVLSSYQRRIAEQFGIEPGEEMKVAVQVAKEKDKTLLLADRNIQTTLSRVWNMMNITGKLKVMMALVMSIFSDEEIAEEELEALRKGDALSAALNEMAESFPQLKKTLIDERDQYIANKLKKAEGKKILAVLGAGHLPGVQLELFKEQDMKNISSVPQKNKSWRKIGWLIPILVVGLLITTFSHDAPSGWDGVIAWILWNGSFSALGALLALGHPLSILTAFLVAPISSLNPLLAAGWFAGLVEAFVRKPKVEDFEHLSTDLTNVKGFWKNHVTRVLLVVVFANIGSTIGTLVGGGEVIRVFIKTVFGG